MGIQSPVRSKDLSTAACVPEIKRKKVTWARSHCHSRNINSAGMQQGLYSLKFRSHQSGECLLVLQQVWPPGAFKANWTEFFIKRYHLIPILPSFHPKAITRSWNSPLALHISLHYRNRLNTGCFCSACMHISAVYLRLHGIDWSLCSEMFKKKATCWNPTSSFDWPWFKPVFGENPVLWHQIVIKFMFTIRLDVQN